MKKTGVFIKFFFIFAIGCSSGWLLEVIFRRFFSKSNKARKWIDPGFLNGPWLPLYGFGLCILYLLSHLEPYFGGLGWLGYPLLFLTMAISMTTIEYLAGHLSRKHLRTKLWDYSEEWGNIDGLICPKFSLFWTILGAIYCFFLHKPLSIIINAALQSTFFTFVLGIYLGVFLFDLSLSCSIPDRLKSIRIFEKVQKRIGRSS